MRCVFVEYHNSWPFHILLRKAYKSLHREARKERKTLGEIHYKKLSSLHKKEDAQAFAMHARFI